MGDAARMLSETECEQLFHLLFPHGLDSEDVLQTLAPEGWERSPLRFCFHPTAEQVFAESVQIHRNLAKLRRPGDPRPPLPESTLEEIRAVHREEPIEPRKECRQLLGRCLWDIFADNHEVLAPDGRLCDLGSFRAAGGFIADWLNARLGTGRERYDYIDFYMGSCFIGRRAALLPLYAFIFQRLRDHGCDWRYTFPQLYVVDLQPLREQLNATRDEPEWADYSPSEALAEEEGKSKREAELEELRSRLQQSHREAAALARHAPPPPTVQAYRQVFGAFPAGWPPPGA